MVGKTSVFKFKHKVLNISQGGIHEMFLNRIQGMNLEKQAGHERSLRKTDARKKKLMGTNACM